MSSYFAHLGPLLPYLEQASAAVGIPTDIVLFLTLSVLWVPLSAIFRTIQSPQSRLLVSLLLGLSSCLILYGPVASVLLVLFVISQYHFMFLISPWKLTILCLVILLGEHFRRMVTDFLAYRMEVSSTLMLVVAKLSMSAFHIDDGRKILRKEKLHRKEHIEKRRQETAIMEDPSLFEFLSYAFHYGGEVVGPVCSYRTYMNFIFRRNEFEKKISPWRAALVLCLYVMASAVMCLIHMHYFSPDLLHSEWFEKQPFAKQLLFLLLGSNLTHYKFYFVWYFRELSNVIAGFGIQTLDSVTHYDSARNARWRDCELGQNLNSILGAWNISISQWLKECVYERVPAAPKGVSQYLFALFVTRLTAALWHGLYPGYFIGYAQLSLLSVVADAFRAKIWPRVEHSEIGRRIYGVFLWLLLWFGISYGGAAFFALSFERAIRVQRLTYFLAPLLNASFLLILSFIPLKKVTKKEN